MLPDSLERKQEFSEGGGKIAREDTFFFSLSHSPSLLLLLHRRKHTKIFFKKKHSPAPAAHGDVRRLQEEAPRRVPLARGIPEHRHGIKLLSVDRRRHRDARGALVADGRDLREREREKSFKKS